MIAIFVALLAVASAAPHDSDLALGSGSTSSESLDLDIFDTSKFWRELETEIHRMKEKMEEFSKHFPITASTAGFQGNKYVVSVNLTGFDEKDIIVKARDCALIIQAIHKDEKGDSKSFMVLRTLPPNVDASGHWTYDKNVLKITFPVTKEKGNGPEEAATDVNLTDNAEETKAHPVDLKDEVELIPVKY